jgi:DNA polymerase-3 subunit epsilon
VVDLETTGLAVDRCAILEIGAVRVVRLRPGARFTTLIRPELAVPRRISELTGIGDLELEGAPPAGPALRAFRRWLGRAPNAPFVAHNAGFDARFTERALAAAALPPYRAPVLCTRRLARRLLPGLCRYDLDHLCARFGIRNAARHRALGDADATARALVELLRLARQQGVATVGELLDLQERPPRGRRRRRRRE